MKDGYHVVAILGNPARMPGHTLVIPKRHVLSLSELIPAEREELFDTAILFQKKIRKLITPRCDLFCHDPSSVPTIRSAIQDHVHIHLRPYFERDNYSRAALTAGERAVALFPHEPFPEAMENLRLSLAYSEEDAGAGALSGRDPFLEAINDLRSLLAG